jgi:hypothetical protein
MLVVLLSSLEGDIMNEQNGNNTEQQDSKDPKAKDSESGSGNPGRTPGKAEGVEDAEKKGNE